MRIVKLSLVLAAATSLAACTGGSGLSGRGGPNEFAVTRAAPLVVPPDFALVPPRAGEAIPATDARTQAIEALFGGPAPRSDAEKSLLQQSDAERAAAGARSVVGSPETVVVDKGEVTRTILAVPEGAGQEATVSTPQ